MATSTHLPPPVMMESTEVRKWVTHMLCWTCAMYFSAAASSENDQGSINLASNTASVPSTIPSRVAAIQGIVECLNRGRYDRSKLRYPSDLTDDEWAYVEPLIPPAKRGGNKRHVEVREVMNGIMD